MGESAGASTRNYARDALLTLASRVVPLGIAFVGLPVVIAGLGRSRYAVLSLAATLVTYFALFDIGLARAVTRFTARSLARRDIAGFARIVWSAVLGQLVLGTMGALALTVAAPLIVQHVLGLNVHLQEEALSVLYLLAASLPLILVTSTFNGALHAAQRFDLMALLGTPFSVAEVAIPVAGVLLGMGLPEIVGLLLVSRAIALGAYFFTCLTVFAGLVRNIAFDRSSFRSLIQFGGWATVSGAIGPILTYGERFIIVAVLPIASLAFYSPPYMVATSMAVISLSVVGLLFPKFSALTEVDTDHGYRIATSSLTHLVVFLGPLVLVLSAFATPFLTFWLGEVHARNGATVLRFLAAGALFNSLARVPYALLHGLGRPDVTAKLHAAELPFHLFLTWRLVELFGIEGAGLAWAIRAAGDGFLLLVAARRLSPTRTQWALSMRSFAGVASAIAGGAAIGSGVDSLHANPTILLFAPPLLLLAFALMWRLLLDDGSRMRLLQDLRGFRTLT